MNKELKQQAHREFEEQFLKIVKRIEYSEESEKTTGWQDIETELKSSIDSIIDKTVKTVALEVQSRMPSHDAVQEYLSLITNKSDINK